MSWKQSRENKRVSSEDRGKKEIKNEGVGELMAKDVHQQSRVQSTIIMPR